MPISVRCPTCDATLPVPDDRAGQHVRCGGCQNVLPVPQYRMAKPVSARPASAAPAKRRPPREWDDDIDDRPRKAAKQGTSPGVWVGIVAVAFVLLGLTGYGAWVAFGRKNVVAQGPMPVGVNQPPGVNAPPVIGFRPPDPAPPPVLVFDPPPAPVPPFNPNQPFGNRNRMAPPPMPLQPPGRAMTREGLVGKYRDRVKLDASSQYSGPWTVSSAFDGNDQTSWYALEQGGGNPWLMVTFPEDVTVTTVTIRGTREPNYMNGYTVQAGTIELLTADGTVLVTRPEKAVSRDFVVRLAATPGVRKVRFTVTKAENLQQAAVGEFVVE